MRVKVKGDFIREILIRKNKSQNWLAKKICISSGYMTQILNGVKHPSSGVREKIQGYFKDNKFDELFIIER